MGVTETKPFYSYIDNHNIPIRFHFIIMPLTLSFPALFLVQLICFATIPIVVGEDYSLKDMYKSLEWEYPDFTIHDPSSIITVGNKQLIAVTGNAQEDGYDCGIETWYRRGKGPWRPGQCLFRKKPSWVPIEAPGNDGAFWAPELDLKSDGTLTLLYSVSEMNGEEERETTCVGIARSVTGLDGFPHRLTWEDAGEPLTCSQSEDYSYERSVIDPSVFWGFGENENKLFLVTGGGRITGTELDPVTYFQKDGEWLAPNSDDWTDLATGPNRAGDDNWIEAAYIYPDSRTGYYFLFVNWGSCCRGIDSTYEIRVGRSRNPLGPYVDKKGRNMMEGGGYLVAKTNGWVIGPGHTGVYKRGNNQLWMTFHYYDKRREGNSWIGEKRLRFRKGWPHVTKKTSRPFPSNKLD